MLRQRLALISLFTCLFFSVSPLMAQTDLFTGLDVVFVVDQSGSMSGAGDRTATDPNELRFDAMQFAVDWLGELANLEVSETGSIRMAAVYFGDPQYSTILDWETLAPPGGDWSRQRSNLTYLLSASNFNTPFGYTNFEQAFEVTRDLFDRLSPLPEGQYNVRVVIVITDGEPCALYDVDSIGNCADVTRNRAQLSRVNDLVMSAFPTPDYRTYLVAIETSSASYYDIYSDVWFQILREPNTPPRAARVGSPEAMRTAVFAFLQDLRDLLSRTSVTVACELNDAGECETYIPPYTRLARIYIFKAGVDRVTEVSITRPDGRALSRGDSDITVSSDVTSIETWSLNFPDQGVWHIRVDDTVNDVQVEIDQNFANAELLFDATPAVYYQWQSIPIAPYIFYNVNEGGTTARRPVNLDPNFPITMRAYLSTAADVRTELEVPPNPSPTGNPAPQFRTTFIPTTPGEYTVGLVGEVSNVNDPATGIPPFVPVDTRTRGRQQTFLVRPATVTVELDPLLQSQGGDWLATDGAEICVIVSDPSRGGTPLPHLDNLRVEAVLQREDGLVRPSVLPASNGRCSFLGTIAAPEAGDYQITVRGFLTKMDGVEEQVFEQPQALVMHAAPVNYISLRLEDPISENGETARSNIVKPGPFFNSEPLVIRASAVGSDGQAVNLAALAGDGLTPVSEPITLTIRDSQNNDITNGSRLTEIGATDYELSTDAYSVGSYLLEIRGKPLDLRTCGCAYALDIAGQSVGVAATRIVERVIPIEVVYWAGGALLALAALGFGGWRLYRYIDAISSNPLGGTLYFYREFEESGNQKFTTENIGLLNLNQLKRNTKTLRSSAIPTSPRLPIKSMELTNYSADDIRRRGSVRIRVRAESGETHSFTVSPGAGPQQLVGNPATGERYLVEKDPDAETSPLTDF